MADAHSSGTATATRPGLSPVTFPQLGESVVEGTVLQWLVKEGDTIAHDTLLAEIETEKVVAEIPSPFEGVVREFAVEIGQTVPVGTTLLWISTDASAESAAPVAPVVASARPEPEMDNAAAQMTTASEDTTSPTSQVAMPATNGASNGTRDNGTAGYVEPPDAATRYSPAVRKLAIEFGIDPGTVQGTGAGGRVTREDMMRSHAAGSKAEDSVSLQELRTETAAPMPQTAATTQSTPVAPPAPATTPTAPYTQSSDLIPMTTLRRRTAEALTRAAQTIPQAATWVEADVTDLVARRNAEKRAFETREGVPLTYLPWFVMAALAGVRHYPVISSRWTDEGIRLMRNVGMGIAVSTDDGLQVPVVHGAGDYSLTGLARIMHDLITRARDGKLKLDDIQGSTLTLTNPGRFGSYVTQAMVRPGEAAIYSVEAIMEKPVVRNGGIAIRSMVTLGLSFDHRIFDGREAVLFLTTAKQWLENEAASVSL